MNIHVIQCDERYKVIISSLRRRSWRIIWNTWRYWEAAGQISGRHFSMWIPDSEKAFTGLKGLIYFTDGYGMFP